MSKSSVSLLPSARRAKALSSPRRLDTNDLDMEYGRKKTASLRFFSF